MAVGLHPRRANRSKAGLLGLTSVTCLLLITCAHRAGRQATNSMRSLQPTSSTVFIVRTCAAQQGAHQIFHLGILLDSLQKQTDPYWTALLLNSDVQAMGPLMPRHASDPRIRFANVSADSAGYNEWTAAYDVTDAVIHQLHSTPYKWLVVTNGDNTYDPTFLESAKSAGSSANADIVLVDFYSRYKRGNGGLDPVQFGPNACYEARLQSGYVDLGGVMLSLRKFLAEQRRFMDYGAINAQDGMLFADLKASGWRTTRVPKCLFSHSPNPYACSVLGGVWFASAASRQELGDACWSPAKLKEETRANPAIKLAVSSSGLKYATLPDAEHRKSQELYVADQRAFVFEYVSKLRSVRGPYCKRLAAMNYSLDTTWYAQNNVDLKHLSPDALTRHFWANGCIEARPLANYPLHYYRPFLGAASTETNARVDTLVVYIFSDTDPEYADNLAYFLRHGVAANDGADYVVVVQRMDDDLTSPPRVAVKRALDNAPSHVTILHRPNACYDWGAFGWALQHPTVTERGAGYKYWVMLNSSVRGPFLPIAVPRTVAWHRILTTRLGGSNGAHMVGPIISCEGSPFNGNPRAEWRRVPHVQSWLIAMDAVAMEVLRKKSKALTCAKDRWEAVWNGELGASSAVLAAGHNLASLLPRYQGVDWRDPVASKCNQGINPAGDGSFDGLTLMPADTLFVKFKASLVAARHPATMAAKKLSAWADERLLNGVADIASNEFVEDVATHKMPRVGAFLARGSRCFNATAYRERYADVANKNDDAAFMHAALTGQFEGRVMQWTCSAAKTLRILEDDRTLLHAAGHEAPLASDLHPRAFDT